MKAMYFSSNYESVQKHLLSAFNLRGLDTRLVIHMYRYNYQSTQPNNIPNTYFFQSCLKGRGPFLYITKLYLMAKRCKNLCKKENATILHGNMMFDDGFICRYISKSLNIPYVVTVRNSDLNTGFLWKLPWIKTIGYKNLHNASAIIFLSKSYMYNLCNRLPQTLRDCVEKKAYVVPNGIDDFFLDHVNMPKQKPEGVIRLIFVGKINSNKNIEKTIQAIEILRARGQNAELTVVGDILEEKYVDFFVKEYVHYIPPCRKEEVCKYLRQSDIFIMPSHNESFGLVYVEAMSQGLPVIYTKGQGFDGQFPDGYVGYAVHDDCAFEIAQRIESILQNYEEISKHGIAASKAFRWGNIAEKLTEIYLSIA